MMPFDMLYQNLIVELIYTAVIIVASVIVYLATKELYDLSQHKGIKYFRNAFLFFTVAFFFRFVIKFAVVTMGLPRIVHYYPLLLGLAALFVFIYASTMAMFYLLYSVLWKVMENKYNVVLFHMLAIAISFISISTDNFLVLLGLQAAVFLFIAIESYRGFRKNRKSFKLYTSYVLLFAFWILNIIDILVPDFLGLAQLLIYLASALVMILILREVLQKTGMKLKWERKE